MKIFLATQGKMNTPVFLQVISETQLSTDQFIEVSIWSMAVTRYGRGDGKEKLSL